LVAILEQTTDFVGTADTNARATYLNRAGRRIIGVSEDADVSGTMLADCHPAWAARIVTEVGIPQAIEHGVWRGETALRSSTGKDIRVSQLILSHRDPAGKVDYLSTVARDITEQKQLEQALRDADRRKDEFIATLAHELRNPLTLIGNVVELLQRPGASDAETRRGHDLIERQADYLTRLTDDLFDISRITRDKVESAADRRPTP
jgi:PAS domain S-box-containing protein